MQITKNEFRMIIKALKRMEKDMTSARRAPLGEDIDSIRNLLKKLAGKER